MAKKQGQPKDDPIRRFASYLRAGKTIEEAASCAGLTPEQAAKAIEESNDKSKRVFEIANMTAADVLQDALCVLQDLAKHGESEEIQLGAAKELRRFAFEMMRLNKPQAITIDATVSEQKDLWDYDNRTN
jgi:predicted transcriptional regulator